MKTIVCLCLVNFFFTGSALFGALQLEYSTYLGGASEDQGKAIAVDSPLSAYVTGNTYSTNFPVVNAYQASRPGGSSSVFVTCFAPGGCAKFFLDPEPELIVVNMPLF